MSQETDPFVLVVERLKREREEMNRTIALLEARISKNPPPAPAEAKPEAEKEEDRAGTSRKLQSIWGRRRISRDDRGGRGTGRSDPPPQADESGQHYR